MADDLCWNQVVANPIAVVLVAWFASGLVLTWVPERRRLMAIGLLGVLLQGILWRTGLPIFELTNLLVYGYAWVQYDRVRRRPADDSDQSADGNRPSLSASAGRWRWCCWGMAILIGTAALGRHWHWDADWGVTIGQVRWGLFALDFWHTIRLVTFLHEYGSEVEELPSLGHFLLWANLPLYGVIIRPSELLPQLGSMAKPPCWSGVFAPRQLPLIPLGLAKCALAWGMTAVDRSCFFPDHPWAYKCYAIFLLGPWSFVLLYAGINDLQRFIGRVWNLQVPVAWNAPLLRTNLSHFWANWNITLMAVYRDYLFFNRWGLAKPNLYLNTGVVFVAMGLWHALNWYWFLFGVYHWLGFSVFLWYQQRKRAAGRGAEVPSPVGLVASWLVTYLFVCLGWLVPGKLVVYLGLAGG